MGPTAELHEQVATTLSGHGLTGTRKMFGGVALYHGARVFGIVVGDAVYLRVNDVTRKAYDRARMPPLFIPGIEKPSSRYMQVPDPVVHTAASLRAWARQAIATSAVENNPGTAAAHRRRA
jgi:DNA transformation protein